MPHGNPSAKERVFGAPGNLPVYPPLGSLRNEPGTPGSAIFQQTSGPMQDPRILGPCKIPWMYHEITQP